MLQGYIKGVSIRLQHASRLLDVSFKDLSSKFQGHELHKHWRRIADEKINFKNPHLTARRGEFLLLFGSVASIVIKLFLSLWCFQKLMAWFKQFIFVQLICYNLCQGWLLLIINCFSHFSKFRVKLFHLLSENWSYLCPCIIMVYRTRQQPDKDEVFPPCWGW